MTQTQQRLNDSETPESEQEEVPQPTPATRGFSMQLPGRTEAHPLSEVDKHPRILVYGTDHLGAFTLAKGLDDFLEQHGIDLPVYCSKDIANIECNFFNQAPKETLENAILRGDVPSGVVVLSEMRWYDWKGRGYDISTQDKRSQGKLSIRDEIRQLCQQYGVDCIFIDRWPPTEDQKEFESFLKLKPNTHTSTPALSKAL